MYCSDQMTCFFFLRGCERSSRQEGKRCVHITKLLLFDPETLSCVSYYFAVSFKPVLTQKRFLANPLRLRKITTDHHIPAQVNIGCPDDNTELENYMWK